MVSDDQQRDIADQNKVGMITVFAKYGAISNHTLLYQNRRPTS